VTGLYCMGCAPAGGLAEVQMDSAELTVVRAVPKRPASSAARHSRCSSSCAPTETVHSEVPAGLAHPFASVLVHPPVSASKALQYLHHPARRVGEQGWEQSACVAEGAICVEH
jgi:hypothetical protein